jgi:hypothetical protein
MLPSSPLPPSLHTPQALEYDWYPLYNCLLDTNDRTALRNVADALDTALFERSQAINRTTSYVECHEMNLATGVLRIVREEKLKLSKD